MIKLTEKEKIAFVDSYFKNELDLDIIQLSPNLKFRESILKQFEDLLELSKTENLLNWHKSINLPKIDIEDLKERIVETSKGKALLGIRFLGMDISKPFVNVWANYDLNDDLEEIIAISKKEFVKFVPKYVRFFVKPNAELSKKYHHFKEQSFYANKIAEICKKEFPENYFKIDLVPIENLDFMEWYKKLYYEFHLEMNNLKFLVPPNDIEDFKKSIKDKLIYCVHFKGERIGLIAGEKDDFGGEASIYMTEIILCKDFKGKKLATATQRKFIELNHNKYQYIWGKISSRNAPSYCNALKVGRKIVSSEILLPI